jgi:hypothetical protein
MTPRRGYPPHPPRGGQKSGFLDPPEKCLPGAPPGRVRTLLD